MNRVVAWNADKPHRCPECHAVAVSGERPKQFRVYTCCRCGVRFTRWPIIGRLLPETGIRCGEHSTVRQGVLDEALHVIADPGWRANGLGWESARDAVQHLMNDTHPSQFDDDPFDHGGCCQPYVRSGEYYDCDGRPI